MRTLGVAVDDVEVAEELQADNAGLDEDVDEARLKAQKYVSLVGNVVKRTILDEAHVLRNPRTKIYAAIIQMGCAHLHCLTATLLINHAKDLYGYMHLYWKRIFRLEIFLAGDARIYDADFDPEAWRLSDNAEAKSVLPPNDDEHALLYAALDDKLPVYLMDPDNYRKCGRRNDWSPAICKLMIAPILRLIQLRQTMTTKVENENGEWNKIGASIPPCQMYTIELGMNRIQAAKYREVYDTVRPRLYTVLPGEGNPDSVEGKQGIMNQEKYRLLMHSTLDTNLAVMTKRRPKNGTASDVKYFNNWHHEDTDHGASYFFTRTRASNAYAIPRDRLSLAHYLSFMSPKIQWLQVFLGKVCLEGTANDRVVLIFEFPMTQW